MAETPKPDPSDAIRRLIPSSRITPPALPPLRPRQEKFAQKFAETGNATEAAREAGYSPKTASEMGYENLRKPQVQAVIEVVRKSAAEEAGLRNVDVLKLAMNFATIDPIELQDEDGNPLPLAKIRPEVRRCIQGVDIVPVSIRDQDGETVTRYAYRYKLTSKDAALDKLFKHLGMYEKNNEQLAGGIKELMDEVRASAARVPIKP